MINLSFDELPYQALMVKLKELARDDLGDPTVPAENQNKIGTTSAAFSTVEKRDI